METLAGIESVTTELFVLSSMDVAVTVAVAALADGAAAVYVADLVV